MKTEIKINDDLKGNDMLITMFAVLLVLKLAGVVAWSWWIIFIPVYFILGKILLIPFWLFIWAFLVALFSGSRRSRW